MAKSSAKPTYLIALGRRPSRVERFAANELKRALREQLRVEAEPVRLQEVSPRRLGSYPLFILGSQSSNELVASLAGKKAFRPEAHQQGYAAKAVRNPVNPRKRAFVLAGEDERGTLYAVRDLCHYHLSGGRSSQALLRLDSRSHPTTLHRGAVTWDYYIGDWRSYIDRLSEWKQNVLMICGHTYVLEQAEILEYAAERGVDIYLAMGIFSWEFTQIQVHRGQAWLPDPPPKWVKLSPNGYVICPSDPKSLDWQVRRIVDIVRALPKLKGLVFQTGILDFPDCDCEKCSKLPADERYLMMANPVIDALLRERPDLHMIHSIGLRQLLDKEFARGLKNVDHRSVLMIETGGIIPKAEHVDIAHEATFEGGSLIDHAKLYGQAGKYGYTICGCGVGNYDRRDVPEWRDMRRKLMREVYAGLSRSVTKYAMDTSVALVQTRKFGPKDLFLPAFFGEAGWHAGRMKEQSFMKLVEQIRGLTDQDQRVSDPPQTHLKEGDSVYYIKRPEGTLEDGGWIWGQVRTVTPLTGDVCDLLSESESATYTFRLPAGFKKGLKAAALIIRGGKTGKRLLGTSDYIFDVQVNDKKLRGLVCPWKRGTRRVMPGTFLSGSRKERLMAKIANRFEGKTDWEIKIPRSQLRARTSITLHFRDPDGLVMYDKMSLRLDY